MILPRNRFMVSMPESEKTVYLTFDDGPDPVYTNLVLEELNKTGIQATFFVIGEKAEKNPELIKRIFKEGHLLGHHTYFHKQPEEVDAKQLKEELEKTETIIQAITGQTTKLFRPPLGKLTISKMLTIWNKGMSICLWNNDPKDFACENVEQVLDHFQNKPIGSGDVVLMHDNKPFAAETIIHLAKQAEKKNLKFATLSSI